MKKLLNQNGFILIAAFFFTVSILIGCGSGNDLQSQVSGTWKRTKGEGSVEINLEKTPYSLKFNDKLYSATIDKIDKENNNLYLKVETAAGQIENWTLHQVWDDTGSSFKITFTHNGTKEILESKIHTR
jgi:uncharacterized protein YlxW (UPF0749 family)